jgi:hypothetical protein
MTNPATRKSPLSSTQIITLAILGIALWLLAALLLRVLGPMGALQGYPRILVYALVVPGTYPFILLAQRVATLARHQTAYGIAIVTAAATLMDGIALAWFPALYGATPELVVASAGAILWGVGVGLVLALVMDKAGQEE